MGDMTVPVEAKKTEELIEAVVDTTTSQLELGEYKDIQLISSRRVSTDSLTTPCQPLLINQELSGPDQDQVVLVGREREQ